LVEEIGVDLGPEDHKLQGIGRLSHLNPSGFQENFLINDLGRYILHHCGGSGKHFPKLSKIDDLKLDSLSDSDFAFYSSKVLNDDRIRPDVRGKVLFHYGVSNLNQYFYDYFDTSCWGFKDVHSGIYMSCYIKTWPDSKWICVFRKPSSFVKSAKQLSKRVSLNTWAEYYQRVMLFDQKVPIYWLSFEDLISKDETLLRSLIGFITGNSCENDSLTRLMDIINPSAVHYINGNPNDFGSAGEIYEELKKKSDSSRTKFVY
jgi:hypothetical protein